MALFHAVPYRKPRVFMPAFMKRLNLVCRSHIHPWLKTRMTLIGQSTSNDGQPMAIYACPTCGWREGWVQDYVTGNPRRLWGSLHDGR